MLKIGITGGIGSGKTTICRVFETLGIPVFYADDEGKNIMHTDPELKDAIIKNFGPKAYFVTGQLDKKYIANIVFNNSDQLKLLNSLVHPAVFKAFNAWQFEQKTAYVLKEAALLFESSSYKLCDYTVLVKAPESLKVARVISRDQITAEQVHLRMAKQLTDEQKEKLADFILLNDEKTLLINQVLDLHHHFLSLSSNS